MVWCRSKDVAEVHIFHGFLVLWDKDNLKYGIHGHETDNQKNEAVSLSWWSEGFLGWEAEM